MASQRELSSRVFEMWIKNRLGRGVGRRGNRCGLELLKQHNCWGVEIATGDTREAREQARMEVPVSSTIIEAHY
jgi:hypothetical protein